MRKLKVRRHPLPGVGELLEFTTASGLVLGVVSHRSGRRDVVIREPGEDTASSSAALTRTEAAALATMLTGAYIELSSSQAH